MCRSIFCNLDGGGQTTQLNLRRVFPSQHPQPPTPPNPQPAFASRCDYTRYGRMQRAHSCTVYTIYTGQQLRKKLRLQRSVDPQKTLSSRAVQKGREEGGGGGGGNDRTRLQTLWRRVIELSAHKLNGTMADDKTHQKESKLANISHKTGHRDSLS